MKQSREDGHAADRRYYLILLGCAIAVAVAAFLLFAQPQFADTDTLNNYEYTEEDSVSASDSVERIPALHTEDETAAEEEAEDADDADTETSDSDDEESDDQAGQETTAPVEQAEPTFSAPLSAATVVRGYSVDALSYDVTMEDWRTHAATDFGGESGDDVMAVADGTVTEVGENALYGSYLVIEHSDSLQSRYAGIADLNVAKGDSVSSGQVIAHLGDPMPAEAKQGVHLHLELIQDGKAANIQEYLETLSSED